MYIKRFFKTLIMKTLKYFSLVLLIVSAGVMGCKKNKQEEPAENHYSTIVGRWSLARLDVKHDGITETAMGTPDDYAQFDAGGKFFGNVLGSDVGVVTSTWDLIRNKTIYINSTADVGFPPAGFEILIIEDNVMVLRAKRDGAEATFYFNRTVPRTK